MKSIKDIYERLAIEHVDCKFSFDEEKNMIEGEIESYKIIGLPREVIFLKKGYELYRKRINNYDDLHFVFDNYINNRKKLGLKKLYKDIVFVLIIVVALLLLFVLLNFVG